VALFGAQGRIEIMRFEAVIGLGSEKKRIEIERLGEATFRVAGVERQVDLSVLEPGVYSLVVEGRSYEVSVREEKKGYLVDIGAHLIPVRLEDPLARAGTAAASAVEGEAVITSPMPGRVVGIKIDVGQEVKEGEGVVVVEAMKMENELHAPKGGKVTQVLVKVGDAVEAGQDLVTIE
jgi:biotin carboxyl carrier protein